MPIYHMQNGITICFTPDADIGIVYEKFVNQIFNDFTILNSAN
jgi:hypothetical protein